MTDFLQLFLSGLATGQHLRVVGADVTKAGLRAVRPIRTLSAYSWAAQRQPDWRYHLAKRIKPKD